MELLRSIFDQLGINSTFFSQFILVAISVVALSSLAFNKVLKVLILRDQKTKVAKKESEELLFESEGLKKDYDKKWSLYQDKADRIKEEYYQKSRSKSEQIINTSKEEATKYLESERIKIEKTTEQEMLELNKDSLELVNDIKKKLLEGIPRRL